MNASRRKAHPVSDDHTPGSLRQGNRWMRPSACKPPDKRSFTLQLSSPLIHHA